MGSKTATADRNRERAATTEELMQNIMTGGEISKRREAELEKAAAGGRGIQFVLDSPTVKGLTQIDPVTGQKKPVFRTGATAADYTGRFTASPPTFGEMFGDMKRALFGGTAEAQPYIYSPTTAPGTSTQTFRQFTPQPRQETGIIPALAEKFLVPGGITLGIAKDLFQKFFPGQEEEKTGMNMQDFGALQTALVERPVSTGVSSDQKRNTLKLLIETDQAPGASELDVDTMSDEEVLLRLQSYGQGFAMGGLTDTIPPERGPMSEGVASLFKYK